MYVLLLHKAKWWGRGWRMGLVDNGGGGLVGCICHDVGYVMHCC